MVNINFQLQKEKKIEIIQRIQKIITIFLILVAVFFIKYTVSNGFISAKKFLEQSVLQTSSNLSGRIANSENEMKVLSEKFTFSISTYSEYEIIEFFKKHLADYDFFRLIYVYSDGKQISWSKDAQKISYASYIDEDTINRAFEGEVVFIGIKQEKKVESKHVHEYAVPVYDKTHKNIVGVLATRIDSGRFINILSFNNYDKKGHSYIMDVYGNIVIKPASDTTKYKNFFERKMKYIGSNEEAIQELIRSNKKGSFLFKEHGQKYLAGFSVIEPTDRVVLTIVPIQVLMMHIDRLLWTIVLVVFLISVILLSLSHYINVLLKEEQAIVYEVAFLDEVTGGGNRNKFILEATEFLNINKDSNYALIAMGLGNFKSLKELYGTDITNKILKDVYNILKHNLPENSLCIRDFDASYLILYKYEKEEFITKYFIDKIRDEIVLYNEKQMRELSTDTEAIISAKLAVRFGIYLINDLSVPIDLICERAYIAKRTLQDDIVNIYRFYDDALRAKIIKEKRIEDEMYDALEDNQFHLYLQPKFNLSDGKLAGAEALVRWIHPREGLIPPIEFIPLFEKNGFVMEIDRYIWKKTCEYISERKKQGKELFPISVNVSRLHLNNDSFVSDLFLLTKKYGISPRYIELELTESASFNDEEKFLDIVHKLKTFDFTIAMDDFGTGYSSLTLLKQLPVDVLKLDRGFIKDTISDRKGQIVIQSIIDMANKLNITTVAEGIEREDQAEFLRNVGCQIAQGFLYGKPVDIDTFVQLFLENETNTNAQ